MKGNGSVMSEKPAKLQAKGNCGNEVSKPPASHRESFRRFAHAVARVVGSAWCFLAALLLIVGWGVTGPLFHFSDTWQLVINTFTTIITFLMVFLIQNTQNRDSKAIHLKLDELLRGVKGAHNIFVG